MLTTSFSIRVIDSLGAYDPTVWSELLSASESRFVFLTQAWQSAWWDVFGRGRLLLVSVERDGQCTALAPLFCDAGMVFFVGSGGSDYLDFIGDISEPEVLEAILLVARESTPDFVGFRLYHVPDCSRTGRMLQRAADKLGWRCFDEGELPAPALEFDSWPPQKRQPAEKKSLVRHERQLSRHGRLVVRHSGDGEQIRSKLQEFFQQHIQRWAQTATPSLFLNEDQRRFYRRLTEVPRSPNWLRFTQIDWEDKSVAFHFGSCFEGAYLWYKPTFDIELSRYSPGEVLLRQVILDAQRENARVFDFGLGDETFKQRFATRVNWVRTWGLYPTETARDEGES